MQCALTVHMVVMYILECLKTCVAIEYYTMTMTSHCCLKCAFECTNLRFYVRIYTHYARFHTHCLSYVMSHDPLESMDQCLNCTKPHFLVEYQSHTSKISILTVGLPSVVSIWTNVCFKTDMYQRGQAE